MLDLDKWYESALLDLYIMVWERYARSIHNGVRADVLDISFNFTIFSTGKELSLAFVERIRIEFSWENTKRVSMKAAGNEIVVGIRVNFDWKKTENR